MEARGARSGSLWTQALRRLLRKKIAVACIVVIAVMYLAGIFTIFRSPTPYGFNDQNIRAEAVKQGPSLSHPFGTDRLGRDLLTRVIYGLRTTVIITIAAMLTGSLFLGIGLGLISGYFGRWADSIIMRVGEVFLAFPGLLLVILIAATVKPRVKDWVEGWAPSLESFTGIDIIQLGIVDYVVIFGALAAFSWVGMARLVRGQVLYVKQSQYVEAAIAMGASTPRILVSHVLPNIISPVIVVVSIGMGATAGSEIILSWLGIGIQPPTPSLGVMIFENGNISVLRTDPHLILFPVLTITVLIFAFNLLGDALNDALNPRTR
ncbi:MAG: ABC transporter permease [Chloroflexi bacterium]|nr:ABC transporter permease [Chloroflexota bacterium]